MSVPEISDEKIEEMLTRMRPVVRFAEGAEGAFRHDKGILHYIQPVDPRGIAFTWSPKPAEKATGLETLKKITTDHTYSYHGFFKPTIAEVLAQIPEDLEEKVVAFETNYAGMGGDFHFGATQLYKRATQTRPILTADAIIRYDNGVLLQDREREPYGLALPGGKVELNETMEEAVRREVREEVGLELGNLEFFGKYDSIGRDTRGHYISSVFTGDAVGEPICGDGVKGLQVVTSETLDSFRDEIAFDHHEILAAYFSK